ncbi:hypothetical protein ACJX0J_021754, partial [Zea mays]
MIWLCYLYYTNYNFWVEIESTLEVRRHNTMIVNFVITTFQPSPHFAIDSTDPKSKYLNKKNELIKEYPRQKSHNMIFSLTYISATSQSSITCTKKQTTNSHTHTTTHVFYSLTTNSHTHTTTGSYLVESLVNLLGEPRVSNHLLVIALETSIAQRMISYHTALTFLHCNLLLEQHRGPILLLK